MLIQHELQIDDNYQLHFITADAQDNFTQAKNAARILVVKLDALGDFTLLTPFLENLRGCYPAADIALCVAQPSLSLAELCPFVNRAIAAPPATRADASAAFMFGLQLNMAHGPFDLVFVPRWEIDYYNAGRIAAATDAPVRISFSINGAPGKAACDPEADMHYTVVVEDHAQRHTVPRNLMLLRALGFTLATPPETHLWATADDEKHAREFMRQHHLKPQQFCVLGIGASFADRCWPPDYFAALAKMLDEKFSLPAILIGGGAADAASATHIMACPDHNSINAVNQLSMPQSFALLQQARLFIGNDSFPMHCAAAAGIPVVEISGHPNDRDPHSEHHYTRFGPWGVPFMYLAPATCPPDQGKCIEKIEPATVLQAIEEIMTP